MERDWSQLRRRIRLNSKLNDVRGRVLSQESLPSIHDVFSKVICQDHLWKVMLEGKVVSSPSHGALGSHFENSVLRIELKEMKYGTNRPNGPREIIHRLREIRLGNTNENKSEPSINQIGPGKNSQQTLFCEHYEKYFMGKS